MTAVSSTTTNFASGPARAVVVPTPRAASTDAPSTADAQVKTDLPQATLSKLAAQPAGAANASANANAHASGNTEAILQSEIKELQVKMDKLNPELAFIIDQDSGKTTIQLTDRTTKEVIQQFPTEAAKQISKALDRFVKGQLVNKQA